MDAKGTTRRRTAFARLLTFGAVLLLFVLLVTPGDAAPGSYVASPTTTIGLQQALATNMVALGGGGYGKVHCPDWWWPRSPCKPPWPPYWTPGPPYWLPRPPYWVPGPPYWVPRPPIWSGWWWQ
ncbi:MAG: hypothetical protein GXY19_15230 [Phycisphaerae bacterium]|nr:hypothetical protein [Phycisphaerae bacterium]